MCSDNRHSVYMETKAAVTERQLEMKTTEVCKREEECFSMKALLCPKETRVAVLNDTYERSFYREMSNRISFLCKCKLNMMLCLYSEKRPTYSAI